MHGEEMSQSKVSEKGESVSRKSRDKLQLAALDLEGKDGLGMKYNNVSAASLAINNSLFFS